MITTKNRRCIQCSGRIRGHFISELCLNCRNIAEVGKTYGSLSVLGVSGKRLIIKCKCGKEFTATPQFKYNMIAGNQTSCKCGVHRSNANKKESLKTPLRIAYGSRKAWSFKRGLEWKLTMPEFVELTSMPCLYCGEAHSNKMRGRKRKDGTRAPDLHYNGIDRVDNSLGYTIENSVPCCIKCNMMKNVYSVDDFISHCKQIVKHFKSDTYAPYKCQGL